MSENTVVVAENWTESDETTKGGEAVFKETSNEEIHGKIPDVSPGNVACDRWPTAQQGLDDDRDDDATSTENKSVTFDVQPRPVVTMDDQHTEFTTGDTSEVNVASSDTAPALVSRPQQTPEYTNSVTVSPAPQPQAQCENDHVEGDKCPSPARSMETHIVETTSDGTGMDCKTEGQVEAGNQRETAVTSESHDVLEISTAVSGKEKTSTMATDSIEKSDKTKSPEPSPGSPEGETENAAPQPRTGSSPIPMETNTISDSPEKSAHLELDTAVAMEAKDAGGSVSGATAAVAVAAAAVAAAAAAAASGPDSAKAMSDKAPLQSVYHVKWIQFKSQTVAIVTQNENGPCPLLAIINCLLLQGRIKLPAVVEMVTSGQLMEYLGDCILESAPKGITEDAQLNYEQNMQDAMDVFHKLQTGLDVNVKFTGVSDFEYTRECIVFDLLNLALYHGWLVDPESPEVVAAVGNCSYNQLVEKIISQKNSNREELMTEALIAEEFLDRTAAQLTYHGLSELVTSIKEDELCVFFRNNHFSTLYKHKNELFLLVTDQGFLTESSVVWETLANVEGDGHFTDANFRTFRKAEPSTAPIAAPEVAVGTPQQIDQDYLVALSLQQEQQLEQQQQQQQEQQAQQAPAGVEWQADTPPVLEAGLSDHELALRLQEEENQKAAMAGQPAQSPTSSTTGGATSGAGTTGPSGTSGRTLQHQQSTSSSGGKREKKSGCAIM